MNNKAYKQNLPTCASECTSYLACRHCIGKNCRNYVMSCEVIKVMTGSRVKIIVFGDMGWKGSETKSRIRYVDKHRVTAK